MDVLSLLKQDHKTVGDMIDAVKECEPGDARLSELSRQISQALTVHAAIEEEFFYPALRDRAEDEEERVDVFEAFTEHDVVKHLIALLNGRKPAEEFKAELQVLGENVKHHVKEEESTIFALARELMDEDELNELGEEMAAEKERLMASGRRTGGRKTATRKNSARSNGGRKASGRKSARKTTTAGRKPAKKTARKRR